MSNFFICFMVLFQKLAFFLCINQLYFQNIVFFLNIIGDDFKFISNKSIFN